MTPPAELKLDHVAIPVGDAAATHKFYTEVLGLPLLDAIDGDDWGGFPWLMMIFAAADNRQLALIAFKGGEYGKSKLPNDSRHYAFSVADRAQLAAWKKKLDAANVKFSEEDHGTQQSIYFEDPNGIVLEITAPASASGAKPNRGAAAAIDAWIDRYSAQ